MRRKYAWAVNTLLLFCAGAVSAATPKVLDALETLRGSAAHGSYYDQSASNVATGPTVSAVAGGHGSSASLTSYSQKAEDGAGVLVPAGKSGAASAGKDGFLKIAGRVLLNAALAAVIVGAIGAVLGGLFGLLGVLFGGSLAEAGVAAVSLGVIGAAMGLIEGFSTRE